MCKTQSDEQVNTHWDIEILHWFKKNCPGVVSADTQNCWYRYRFWNSGIKPSLVTTKVCRIPSLNAQRIKPWSRWATAAEDHTRCRSCQLRTGNAGYNSHRLTKIGTIRRLENVAWSDKSQFLLDPSCLVSTVQAGCGGEMVWGIYSWHTLDPLVPIEHHLNATAYLSIVSDHVHPFMTTVYPSSDATSSRIMHLVTKLKSSQTGFTVWVHFTQMASTVTRSQSKRVPLGCGGTGEICSNCVLISCQYGPKSLRNVLQQLVESMPWRIKAVLKTKGGPTQY